MAERKRRRQQLLELRKGVGKGGKKGKKIFSWSCASCVL
jgi:hypothetical protein